MILSDGRYKNVVADFANIPQTLRAVETSANEFPERHQLQAPGVIHE
jgi:hypothetical protein